MIVYIENRVFLHLLLGCRRRSQKINSNRTQVDLVCASLFFGDLTVFRDARVPCISTVKCEHSVHLP